MTYEEIIAEALEKQIPRESEWSYNGFRCPTCGRLVEEVMNYRDDAERPYYWNYCAYCGQRFDLNRITQKRIDIDALEAALENEED